MKAAVKKAKPGAGRPTETIRWTVERAAKEFGPDRRSIGKRLGEEGIEPSSDGKYSTRDICRAIYESNDPRKDRDREQAENFRLRNAELRKERVPSDEVFAVWDATLQSVAATLKAHRGKPLTPELINEVFAQFRAAKLPC